MDDISIPLLLSDISAGWWEQMGSRLTRMFRAMSENKFHNFFYFTTFSHNCCHGRTWAERLLSLPVKVPRGSCLSQRGWQFYFLQSYSFVFANKTQTSVRSYDSPNRTPSQTFITVVHLFSSLFLFLTICLSDWSTLLILRLLTSTTRILCALILFAIMLHRNFHYKSIRLNTF